MSPGLSPSVFVLAAEAKAAEAAASAYYNPGNPHNVYMPTVSRARARAARCRGLGVGRSGLVVNLLMRSFFLPSSDPASATSLLPPGR